jgi:glutaconate CoA-transferase, subunit B
VRVFTHLIPFAGGNAIIRQGRRNLTLIRMLRDGAVCFVGIGLPAKAANLARVTHAPQAVLIYE